MPAFALHPDIRKPSRLGRFIGGVKAGDRLRLYMAKYGVTLAGHPLWTKFENSILQRSYPDYERAHAALRRRTSKAIQSKAFRLKITRPLRIWSATELSRLKSAYRTGMPIGEIQALIPGKTAKQIWSKAAHSGWRRPRRLPKRTGVQPYDAVRTRAFDYKLSMRDLAGLSATGQYFTAGAARTNWKKISKAVALLEGQLSIKWQEQ